MNRSCLVVLIINALIGLSVSLWTQSSLTWILTLIKGTFVTVPFWISIAVSFFLGSSVIAFNIIIELLKLIF